VDLELKFEPEYVPDAVECMQLSAQVRMPGHPVMLRLMKSVVDEFLVDARNADTGSARDCQEKIRRSQVSAHVFQAFVDKINSYVTAYTLAERARPAGEVVEPDPTEVLDLGGLTSDLKGVENLFATDNFEESLF